MPPRRLDQPILPRPLGPIRRIGRRDFRLLPIELAPDAPDQAKTITANALGGRLMAIGRTDPPLGEGEDLGINGGHTIPLTQTAPTRHGWSGR